MRTLIVFLFVTIVIAISIPFYAKVIILTLVLLAFFKDKKDDKRKKTFSEDEVNRFISKDKEVFYLAERLDNRLTIEDVTLNTSLNYEESKRMLESFSKQSIVKPMMTDDGIFVYQFPNMPYCPKVIDLTKRSNSEIQEAILTFARINDKKLSVAAIAKCTTLSVDDIIVIMERYCKKGIAIKDDTNLLTYNFPGLLSEEEKKRAKDIW
ncbi:MAG: hypothetical protein CR982_05210 [Candidatus Cloacimonadota bacterium]|nr:MAG: hypothetical protein CR982_05210 [Candidatus Cloacimonadota bacterium]PIE78561.1 MAG: hypothetical protein CSA15_07190 [Candidatus Delongbacteria bacterium]